MTIDDFVRNRWADAKEALRELDSDFVSALESRLEMERIGLWAPPVMVSNSEKQPTKRLSKRWHSLLEACFELTVMTRNYQACCRNLTSDAVSGMDDFEAGRLFAYSYYTWVFYQDAVIEHTKTIISHVSRVYGARDGTPTQLKKLYHEKADPLAPMRLYLRMRQRRPRSPAPPKRTGKPWLPSTTQRTVRTGISTTTG